MRKRTVTSTFPHISSQNLKKIYLRFSLDAAYKPTASELRRVLAVLLSFSQALTKTPVSTRNVTYGLAKKTTQCLFANPKAIKNIIKNIFYHLLPLIRVSESF